MGDNNDSLNAYEGCCEVAAIEMSIGNGNVYIPNIFTPNGDLVNDQFHIYGDSGIEEIEKLTIKDLDGQILYEKEGVSLAPFDYTHTWKPSSEEAPKGLFNYSATIKSVDGITETISSTACSMVCKTETDSVLLSNKINCLFGTQHNGVGEVVPLAPSLENSNCF